VLQATIDNLCSLNSAFSILVAQLAATNVTIFNVDSYIAAYLASSPLASSKMVPYAPIPYFGPLSNYPSIGDSFSISGVGSGYWANVYLCNGDNGTPDLRGWTLVGVTTGMGGGTLNSIVDPAVNPDNPVYTISGPDSLNGSTTVTLGIGQIPNHTHPNTIVTTFNDPEHRHKFSDDTTSPLNTLRTSNDIFPFGSVPYTTANISADGTGTGQIYLTSEESTGITVDVDLTNAGMGGGGAHSNVQPSKGCYYIMYKP
jgi:microcystin-dependent protein